MNDERAILSITFRDGTVIDTFSEWDLSLDMLDVGCPWTLTCWSSDVRQSTWDVLFSKALCGERIRVEINGAVQLIGSIRTRNEDIEREQATLTLSGLDLAGPLIKADADPRISLQNTTLGEVIQRLVRPFGISVVFLNGSQDAEVRQNQDRLRTSRRTGDFTPRSRIESFRIRPGSKVWQEIDSICRRSGYRVWIGPTPDTNEIGIIVDKPIESGEAKYSLIRRKQPDGTYRGNILGSSYRTDISDVPTEVTVFSHSATFGSEDARVCAHVTNEQLRKARVVADMLPQPRYKRSQRARSQANAQREAERDLAQANANLSVYQASVRGVMQNGIIYAFNSIYAINDERHKLYEKMQCTRVDFHQGRDNQGTKTKLRCVPLGSIKVFPDEEL
mgnify:CR=1 FL=1